MLFYWPILFIESAWSVYRLIRSTSGWVGNAHFFTYTRIRSRETGENRKSNEQTKLGVTKSRGRYATLMHVRTIASVVRQLSFASPYHFRIRRDFRSKNPLSGFAPKQTRLLWRPTPIVLHTSLSYPCHLFSINYNTI